MSCPGEWFWRDACTLIVAAPIKEAQQSTGDPLTPAATDTVQQHTNAHPGPGYDYRLLFIQRSLESKFLPGAYVFPGGTVSLSDFSDEWLDIFLSVVGSSVDEVAGVLKSSGPRPPILLKKTNSRVPTELGLRICAIRETFEETGVLLVRGPGKAKCRSSEFSQIFASQREKVHRDASHFVMMCRDANMVPDVWALVEWANWLTPTATRGPPGRDSKPLKPARNKRQYRFDTMFFVCTLDDLPEAKCDEKESVACKWLSPDIVFHDKSVDKVFLVGPPRYETSKLANYRRLQQLEMFVRERACQGLVRWMPVVRLCTDGVVLLLPGDEDYPSEPDFEGHGPVMTLNKSLLEMRTRTRRSHFAVAGDWSGYRCTIALPLGYPSPDPSHTLTKSNI